MPIGRSMIDAASRWDLVDKTPQQARVLISNATPRLPLSFTSYFDEQPTNEMLLMFKNINAKLQYSNFFIFFKTLSLTFKTPF